MLLRLLANERFYTIGNFFITSTAGLQPGRGQSVAGPSSSCNRTLRAVPHVMACPEKAVWCHSEIDLVSAAVFTSTMTPETRTCLAGPHAELRATRACDATPCYLGGSARNRFGYVLWNGHAMASVPVTTIRKRSAGGVISNR
jgi:hypothetical protein